MASKIDQILEAIKANHRKEYLNVQEASEFLGISTSHLYTIVSERKITHYKPFSKTLLFRRVDLIKFIEKKKVPCMEEQIRQHRQNKSRQSNF